MLSAAVVSAVVSVTLNPPASHPRSLLRVSDQTDVFSSLRIGDSPQLAAESFNYRFGIL